MSSLSNIEKHLQEQPVKKQRGDNLEETENAKPNEVMPNTIEADKNKELALATTKTMADLILSADCHRKLPAELNCQIFYCLNLATRRKFIFGLGWDFYGMFRHRLLTKSKRLCNPPGNGWSQTNEDFMISEDGLIASNNINVWWKHIYAEKGFPISVADCRTDGFPVTICYYYEVKTLSQRCLVGISDDTNHFGILLAEHPDTYAIAAMLKNGRAGRCSFIELLVGARLEQSNVQGNIFGCGILIDPDNKVANFFTLNGVLLVSFCQYNSSVYCPNTIPNGNFFPFRHAGQRHSFEFPDGVIRPELKDAENVVGCGILMNPDDKLTIFFTLNGILIGRQFPIDPTLDVLVPTVKLWDHMSLEANFGDNPAKPFEYDIKHCPGMGLEWI